MNNNRASSERPRIAIFGAGSVGCYLGGRLLSGDADVVMIGRQRLADLFRETPLVVTDYEGFHHETRLAPDQYVTDPEAAAGADVVIVCVKSAATEEAGRQLVPHLQPGTPVITMQNGISNAERLAQVLPQAAVLPGMIPFNVLQKTPGHFHHGTEGHLMCARHPALESLSEVFERTGIPLEQRDDMLSVMWSKLLLNLNNPINALSGKPLLEELNQRDYRRCLSMAQRETLQLLKQAGIPTIRLTPLPTNLFPTLIQAPDWIFRRLAGKMLAIDPVARSSMWEDLEAGRPTEVDWINGEVVALANRLGCEAPVNETLTELVHDCEQTRREWPASELLKTLQRSRHT